jgi:hypothetical protein
MSATTGVQPLAFAISRLKKALTPLEEEHNDQYDTRYSKDGKV